MISAISSAKTFSLAPKHTFPIEGDKQLKIYTIDSKVLKHVDNKVDMFISHSDFAERVEALIAVRDLYTDPKVSKINLIGSGQADLNWVQLRLKKPVLSALSKPVLPPLQQIKAILGMAGV